MYDVDIPRGLEFVLRFPWRDQLWQLESPRELYYMLQLATAPANTPRETRGDRPALHGGHPRTPITGDTPVPPCVAVVAVVGSKGKSVAVVAKASRSSQPSAYPAATLPQTPDGSKRRGRRAGVAVVAVVRSNYHASRSSGRVTMRRGRRVCPQGSTIFRIA